MGNSACLPWCCNGSEGVTGCTGPRGISCRERCHRFKFTCINRSVVRCPVDISRVSPSPLPRPPFPPPYPKERGGREREREGRRRRSQEENRQTLSQLACVFVCCTSFCLLCRLFRESTVSQLFSVLLLSLAINTFSLALI